MAFRVTAKVQGLEGVIKALGNVDKKIRKKAIRKATGEAGKILLKAAKATVRKKTGLLKKSLGRKVKVYKSGIAVAVVGPRMGFRQEVERDGRKVISNPTKYAHLVELGTSHSTAYPFLSAALDSTREQVQSKMLEVLEDALKNG